MKIRTILGLALALGGLALLVITVSSGLSAYSRGLTKLAFGAPPLVIMFYVALTIALRGFGFLGTWRGPGPTVYKVRKGAAEIRQGSRLEG